jgi:flagellar protein FlaG
MLIQPVNRSFEGHETQAKGRLPVEADISRKGKDVEESKKKVDLANLQEVAGNVQTNLNLIHNVELHFNIQSDTGEIVVIVSDEKTGEVIREIPPKKVLNLASRLEEMVGLLFDHQG